MIFPVPIDVKIERVPVPEVAPSGKRWLLNDSGLKEAVTAIYEHLRKDYFFVLVIVGGSGNGKSTLAAQIGYAVDANFGITNLARNSREFNRFLYSGSSFSVPVFDEGGLGMNSRESMTLSNRTLRNNLDIIRFKNMLLIICIPEFDELDTTIRNKRINGLIVVPDRGVFKYHHGKNARYLAANKITWGIPLFMGHFSKVLPFDKDEYMSRKKEGAKAQLKKGAKEGRMTPQEVSARLGVDDETVRRAIKTGVITAESTETLGGRIRYLIKPSEVYKLSKMVRPKKVKVFRGSKPRAKA